MFNVRLITLDHYLSKPIDEIYENKSVVKEKQEPVLRIFGSTADGYKSCVHVHGVYPYIYIPYKGGENPVRDALLIGAALDEALKISLNSNVVQFVHDVILVSGIPLYGYHSKARQFFKIYFYNPYHIRKASELLLSGAILGQKFQPHEAHIPYALQFMMDYNIYGMSFVSFSKVKYRRNPDNPDSLIGVPEEDLLSDKVKKITCSHLEVDALASDIMNRIGQEGVGINPGLRAIWEDEKDRRREQKKNSQPTVQQSQSRADIKIGATEAFYKVQLSEKLKQISPQEPRLIGTPSEPVHSYPAEVPETRDILEASAVVEVIDRIRAKEPVCDLNSLIDQRILSQIAESEKEILESESEEDETEVDSIIGRNHKAEEAEPEDEEGVDMTQPLDVDESIICGVAGIGDEPGNSKIDSEKLFWDCMANKIFQLDGTHDSSSESEADINPSATISEERTSGASLELSSAWSSNIMSILSEDSGCPTPSTLCQTPRTFWANYSPTWFPQNQDPWTWNKNNTTYFESAGKNSTEGLNFENFSEPPKDCISEKPFDFFASNDDEHLPEPSMTALCSAESTASLPSDIVTPVNEAEGSDFNLDSICDSFHFPTKTEKELKFTEIKRTFNRKPEDDRQKCLQVLKSFAGKKIPSEADCDQLTLKQYIKDCEEIVSIDFKNLCNQEMILIEYKTQNKRSLKNKYLIKPLDKFLESWTSAERKAGDRRVPRNKHRTKIMSEFNIEGKKNIHSAVINVLEKRFSDSSRVQSVSNKLTMKAMEILPNGGSRKDSNYNVNQNVISQGKIKMKLIKSQRENSEKNLVDTRLKRQRSEKCFKLDLNKIKSEKGKGSNTSKKKQKIQREGIEKSRTVGTFNKWNKMSEPDSRLINEINSSFEEYFKSIVQRKKLNRKKSNFIRDIRSDKKEAVSEEEEEEEEEEEQEEEEEEIEIEEKKQKVKEKADVSNTRKRHFINNQMSSGGDPLKLVTRFLASFSRMSDVPPLTITISLGNPQIPMPLQVNLQPIVASSENEVNCFSKKEGKKLTLENVDGPADDSSDDESSNGGPARLRKRVKREGYYKPLNVVVYSSPSEPKRKEKRRNVSSPCGNPDEEGQTGGKKERNFSTRPVEEKPNPFPSCEKKKAKITSQSQMKSTKNPKNLKKSFFDGKLRESEKYRPVSSQEQEIVDITNVGNKSKESKQRSLKLPKTKNIPQADTELCSSSDDDGLGLIHKQISGTEDGSAVFGSKKISKSMSEGSNEKGAEKMDEVVNETPVTSNDVPVVRPDEEDSEKKRHPFPEADISCHAGIVSAVSSSKTFLTQPTCSSLNFKANDSPDSQLIPTKQDSVGSQCSAKPFSKIATDAGRVNSLGEADLISDSFGSLRSSGEGSSHFGSSKSSGKGDGSSLDWVVGCKTIRPKQKPIVWATVFESLLRDDIFEREENLPFYSDPHDEAKAVQVGPRFFKVRNRSLARLKVFKSSLDVLGIEERKMSTREPKAGRCCFVGKDHLRITPVMKPPSPETALKWLFLKNNTDKLKKELKKTKIKLVHPLSPGQKFESDEEMEVSLTISSLSAELETSDPHLKENSFLTKPTSSYDQNVTVKKGPLTKIKRIRNSNALNKISNSEVGQAPVNLKTPPSNGESSSRECKTSSDGSFQIRQISADNINTYGFSHSVEDMKKAKTNGTHQHMSILVMELHVQTRQNLCPDPECDPISALFYAITFDSPVRNPESGILVVGNNLSSESSYSGHSIYYLPTEKALIEKFLEFVKLWDPEILAGYEIEMHSWGYLVERGFILNMNLVFLLGRVQTEDCTKKKLSNISHSGEESNAKSGTHLKISGRIVLDVWRLLRHEVSLTNYSFENVMYHLSHERHPLFSFESLSQYWENTNCRYRHIVIEHYITRVVGVIRILDQLDFVNRTSELSRLFGIQFYEVLSRGSQFRVESMMLRLAKPLNYIPESPSVSQRAAMRAPASLPLILEPESLFYSDPIVVLDFQSLYPSIIIAYNYCFSTCLGRVENLGGREPYEFGCTQLQISPEELRSLENDLNISPAGIAFVKANVRKGILPTMLEEILEARLMVKRSMKENKENKILQKILFARQLGLKLIANVTYGYTAANFSGRMPCIEVGDSVVSKGRETLHRAIQLVKNTRKWGAKVVYGDTDSIFVLIPGRSRQEAFKIGAEIADAVTQDNPKPVKLKMEKVYQPSILQTKKRYVGYMFESPDQEKPVFDAKGIETVRRDGCAAAGKILQTALQILFDTKDISLVKKYTVRQFAKLFQGRVNLQDLIFAKEYRGRRGYRPGACVPALYLAKKWTQFDKRAEPRVKERVPYVIANGPPGVPLIQLVHSPRELLTDRSLHINAIYYITKAIIPPMQRCFTLLGVDVTTWFAEMPRNYHKIYKSLWTECQKRNTISQYFGAAECVACGEISSTFVCPQCEKQPQNFVVCLSEKIRRWERCYENVLKICRSCCGRFSPVECVSLDCPVLFRRKQAERIVEQGPVLREILLRYV